MTMLFRKEQPQVKEQLEWLAVDMFEQGVPSQFDPDQVPALYFKHKDQEHF